VNLYVIWIGGNDYLNGGGDFQGAVANIAEAMAMLISSGAKSLLILNLPNLGEIPDLLTSPDAPEATAFSANFNRELANTIDTFSVDHPDVQIYEFDVNALFQEVRNAPGAFGFTNVTEASPNFSVPNNFDGAGHVFWDDKHPTTGMHAIVADRVYEDMNRQIPADTPDTPAKSDESSSCFIGTLSWI
jgi:phospholipase/lecithinase/hemolysin